MIIGGDFNKKCEKLLKEAGKLCGMKPEKKIRVEVLNQNLGFDRSEIKNYFEFLSDRGYIRLVSIGGPLLYGHIALTSEGVKKLRDFENRSDDE